MTMHHAFVGGLLEHVVSLIGLGRAIAEHYPELDADLLLAGIVLHDIGKIDELSYARGIGYTTEGRLLGHITIGTLLVREKIKAIPGFPRAAGDADRTFDSEPSRLVRVRLAIFAADARSDCAAFSGRYGFENGGDARDAGRRVGEATSGLSEIRRCAARCCGPDKFLAGEDARWIGGRCCG